jgi:hypothetical protein
MQLQDVSAALHVPFPQQLERHCGSAQSALPLQSSSTPLVQLISEGASGPQSCKQAPVQRSACVQVPLGHVVHGGNGQKLQLTPPMLLQSR